MRANARLADYARTAAELVEEGWCQHRMEDAEGRVCAVGAATKAIFGRQLKGYELMSFLGDRRDAELQKYKDRNLLVEIAAMYLEKGDGLSAGFIVQRWNDDPSRTGSEVADMWRKVADELVAL